jgi:hypothetical protein
MPSPFLYSAYVQRYNNHVYKIILQRLDYPVRWSISMHFLVTLLVELAISAVYHLYRAPRRVITPAGYGPTLACGSATIRGEGTVTRCTR